MSLINFPFCNSDRSSSPIRLGCLKDDSDPQEFVDHPDGRRLSLSKILSIMNRLEHLTLPYCDSKGNSLQIWKIRPAQLLGTIHDKKGRITVVSGDKIRLLSTKSSSPALIIQQLEQFPPKEWHLIFNQQTNELDLWPLLRAAGKDWSIEVEKSPYKDMTKEQVLQKLLNDGFVYSGKANDNGKASYVHPETGEKAYIDPRNQGRYGEPNHVDFVTSLGDKIRYHYKDPYGLHQFHLKKQTHRAGEDINHVQKIREIQQRLKNTMHDEKATFRKFSLSPQEREKSEGRLGEASKLLDFTKKYLAYKANELINKNKGNPPDNGGGGGASNKGPGNQQFRETVQKNGLTSSYQADSPIPAKGAMSSEIGGIGCTAELIQGVFDNANALFEDEHLFFVPAFDGELPMTNQELGQILRELAIGIYVHGTVPFFSLHFNQNSDLYPVIHPAYENTLVGQAISLLDYFMKGYLNGGIFKEEFIKQWEEDPNWERKKDSALSEMIDFTSYCKQNLQGVDQTYISLRKLLSLSTNPNVIKNLGETIEAALSSEPSIFKDTTLFSNSFRIIAKQKSIQKADNLFMLDADFDVCYTIDPAPAYKKELEQYQKIHGHFPPSYQRMIDAYEGMKEQIHNHMVKLPICSKYFAMLGVINFFSSYMITLKKHRKTPNFSMLHSKAHSSPALFPHLPLENFKKEKLTINFSEIVEKICASQASLLHQYFTKPTDLMKDRVTEELQTLLRENILSSCSASMRRYQEMNPQSLYKAFESAATTLLNTLKEKYNESVKDLSNLQQNFKSKEDITKALDFNHSIRDMYSFTFSMKTNGISDSQAKALNYIRQMPDSEYKSAEDQLRVLLLDKKDLSLYIIKNLSKNFIKKNFDWLEFQANILLIPSDAPITAVEQGKRVVGGCGMKLLPLKATASIQGEGILMEHSRVLQELDPEKWVKIGNETDNRLQGSIFKLKFEDLALEQDEDYSWMEYLFDTVSPELACILSAIRAEFLEALNEDNEDKFTLLLQDYADLLSQIRKPDTGASLVHIAAMHKNPVYMKKLLTAGLSANIKDKKQCLPIHYAAMYGNVDIINVLLLLNSKFLNAENNNKATPLIVAIQHGQEFTVKYLLDHKASVNTITAAGYTPLHSALHHGNEVISMALMGQHGVDVNKATEEGVTPLMLACDLDSKNLVLEILRKGANPHAERKDGMTALDLAVKRNCFFICEILFPRSHLSDWTIETAIKESSLEILMLLATKPNFLTYRNYSKDTPLILAIRFGNIPAVLHILDLVKEADLLNAENVFKETALSLSLACGFDELTEQLIKKGAKINPKELIKNLCRRGYTVFLENYISTQKLSPKDLEDLLLAAAEAGQHVVISKLLLPRKVSLDALHSSKGWKIEHYLAKSDGLFLLKLLIFKSKDFLNPLAKEGHKTLAYLAAENESWKCFEFLLNEMIKNKISLDNQYRKHHLAYAVIETGNLTAIRKMLNCDPKLIDKDLDGKGTTAAHLAAKNGLKDVLKLLHALGAKCDREDDEGMTPLYYAIRCKSKGAVKFLISDKCKVKITAEALFLALSAENQKMFQLLAKVEIDINVKSTATQNTPLILAVKNHDYSTFLKLIEFKASLECINAEGWTPTLLASYSGQFDILEAILSKGYIDQSLYFGNSAIHLACRKGHSECVKLLINSGFSNQLLNAENKKPDKLAGNNSSVLIALRSNSEYPHRMATIQVAFQSKNLDIIHKLASLFPVNETVCIRWLNKKLSGTIFHIILRLMGETCTTSFIDNFFLKNPKLDHTLCDHEGLTYAHLLVMAKILPKKLDMSVTDHKGITPLHIAAQKCDETYLLKLFETTNANQVINTSDMHGRTPLTYAVMSRKSKNVEILLKLGADSNHLDLDLNTPLLYACLMNHFPIVQSLRNAGADLNQRVSHKRLTPLLLALSLGYDEISLYLMRHGADCNANMQNGCTAAHVAADSGKVHMLRFLSSKGISLDVANKKGLRPIHTAASKGHNDVLIFLLSQGISFETIVTPLEESTSKKENLASFQNAKPIHFATQAGRIETVQLLLDNHANIESKINNTEGVLASAALANSITLIDIFKKYKLSKDPNQIFPAISAAIAHDYPNVASVLYDLGVAINADIKGQTGLHIACRYGAVRSTPMLLNRGADSTILNIEGKTCLEIAASNPSVDQFWQMLVSTQPDLDKAYGKGDTLLHTAVIASNLAHAILLIDYGISLNIQNHAGETALHLAAKKGHVEITGLLIGCGADESIKTGYNKTARELSNKSSTSDLLDRYKLLKDKAHPSEKLLHLAVKAKIIEAVKLISLSADVNETDSCKKIALHIAVETGSIPLVSTLLSKQADLEAQDELGHTPLWKACVVAPNLLMVRFLIKAGADINCKNKVGETIEEVLHNGNDFFGKEKIRELVKAELSNSKIIDF
ncbi:MAG: ankyrin repeat domain-containing protein [Parachlamydiaceae bacterium]|nr:ankyrin repeat domain-containing protein [Parachlamydiaceae bacterium]